MARRVRDIMEVMEGLAPQNYACDWDNVGLQVGNYGAPINKILLCLDVSREIIEEAISLGADLIISHHPLLFSPLTSIIKEDGKGEIIYRAIKNNINIYSAHTNMDIAPGGLNDYLLDKLDFKNSMVLEIIGKEQLYKLVVFVPKKYEVRVAEALNQGGAGHIGNYSHCSFRVDGIGTFKPMKGTNPFIGELGKVEKVEETRLETIVANTDLDRVIASMLEAHPYEEVAYDVIPLKNSGQERGIGRVAILEDGKDLNELVAMVKTKLGIKHLSVVGDLNKPISRVALVNGSGANYIELAKQRKCDCLITGDVKYHDAQTALELGIAVIDAGHFETEIFFVDLIFNYLTAALEDKGLDIEIVKSKVETSPLQII